MDGLFLSQLGLTLTATELLICKKNLINIMIQRSL
jgi:hypothetical protein